MAMDSGPLPPGRADLAGHLSLVAAMARAFAGSGDFDAMVRDGLARVTRQMQAEASSLFLLEPRADGEPPDMVCHASFGPVSITGLRLPWGKGIVGRSIVLDAPQMVRDVAADPDFGAQVDAATGFETRSILVAPLSVADERFGAIEVINKIGGDHLFDRQDEELLGALAAAAALAISNGRLAARLVGQERLRRDLELAAAIQRGLLPAEPPAAFPVHGLVRPARAVSGDFFDVVSLPDGRIAGAIADVSGKGMNAALVMAKTASLFRCLAKEALPPGRLLARIGDELCETASHGMFVTMAAFLYDPASGALCLANAGHEPPLVLPVPGGAHTPPAPRALDAGGPPLGIAPGLYGPDGVEEVALTLPAGACLLLFTDGLTEAADHTGAMLGSDGAARLFTALPPATATAALPKAWAAAVDDAGYRTHDDLTLMVLRHG